MRQGNELFQHMERMYGEGIPLSRDKISSLLHECSKKKDITSGRIVHSLMISSGLKSIALLGDFLIRLFASCGSFLEANLVFCEVMEPSIYTWHAIISGHSMHGYSKRALELFYNMQKEHIKPGRCTFLCILKVCGSTGAVLQGMLVHDQIIASGLEAELSIGSTLIDMYGKCGNINEAYTVFERLHTRDLVCWSTMIAGYAQGGQSLAALELFEKMKEKGVKPDRAVFLCVLKACGNLGAFRQGKLTHGQVTEDTLESDVAIGSALVDMYARCGSVEDAQRVFDLLEYPDVVSWSALITGYSQHGCCHYTLDLFDRMQVGGIKPDKVMLVSILKACSGVGAIGHGILMHEKIIRAGFESDAFIEGALIDMYIKCGSLEDAHRMFDRLPDRNLILWNAMLAGYVQHEKGDYVLELYDKMLLEGIKPDKSTFVHILKACSFIGDIGQGKLIHDKVISYGFQSDLAIGNALIDMYIKCGCIEIGRQVFDDLANRNLVTWNSIIAGYAQHGHELLAFEFFEQMQEEGVTPDNITFSCIVKACASIRALGQGRVIHEQILATGLESDVFVGTAIVDMYAECGSLEEVHQVFCKLPNKNVVCWNTIIGQYVQLGHDLLALQLFEKMQQDGVDPDKVTFLCILKACGTAAEDMWQQVKSTHDLILRSGLESDIFLGSTLVDMYAKSGDLEAARKVFDSLSHRNVVTWGAMIAGYAQHGQGLAALELITKMQLERIKLDRSTFLVSLKACISTGAVEQGKLMHDQIVRNGLELDLVVGSAIVNMYAKCGSLQDACNVFKKLPNQDVVCWNTLIAGYAQHGDSKLAEQCLKELQRKGIEPADGTYTSVLTACSRVGKVEGGHHHFKGMGENQQTLLHFTCMIDLLGRAGRLEEAVEVMQTMPNLPDATVWLVLLTACKTYGNVNLGRECFNQLRGLNLNVAAGYVLMSNIYADSHMPEDFHKLKELKIFTGVLKKPDMAWIEVDNSVHSSLLEVSSMYRSIKSATS